MTILGLETNLISWADCHWTVLNTGEVTRLESCHRALTGDTNLKTHAREVDGCDWEEVATANTTYRSSVFLRVTVLVGRTTQSRASSEKCLVRCGHPLDLRETTTRER